MRGAEAASDRRKPASVAIYIEYQTIAIVSVILIPMYPRETIRQFDVFLADRGLQFEATVAGGAALGLLGVTFRAKRKTLTSCSRSWRWHQPPQS